MALLRSIDAGLALLDGTYLHGSVSAVLGVETTVILHNVPPGESLLLLDVMVGGTDDGMFLVRVDGSVRATIRTNWTERTKQESLGTERVDGGSEVRVTVTNLGEATATFEARLGGKKP